MLMVHMMNHYLKLPLLLSIPTSNTVKKPKNIGCFNYGEIGHQIKHCRKLKIKCERCGRHQEMHHKDCSRRVTSSNVPYKEHHL